MTEHAADNRRKHTRLTVKVEAEIVFGDQRFKGYTKNISFGGAYLLLEETLDVDLIEPLRMQLILQHTPELAITFNVDALRQGGGQNELAVKFINTDLESYEHFRNLMVYNSPDPNLLIEELEENPGLDIE